MNIKKYKAGALCLAMSLALAACGGNGGDNGSNNGNNSSGNASSSSSSGSTTPTNPTQPVGPNTPSTPSTPSASVPQQELVGFYIGEANSDLNINTSPIALPVQAMERIVLSDGSFWTAYFGTNPDFRGVISRLAGTAYGKGSLPGGDGSTDWKFLASGFDSWWQTRDDQTWSNSLEQMSSQGSSVEFHHDTGGDFKGTDTFPDGLGNSISVGIDSMSFNDFEKSKLLTSPVSDFQGHWRVFDVGLSNYATITLKKDGSFQGVFDNGNLNKEDQSIGCAISGTITSNAENQYFVADIKYDGQGCQSESEQTGAGVFGQTPNGAITLKDMSNFPEDQKAVGFLGLPNGCSLYFDTTFACNDPKADNPLVSALYIITNSKDSGKPGDALIGIQKDKQVN